MTARFYLPGIKNLSAAELPFIERLSAPQSRHATRVLRLSIGDTVEVFDGDGDAFAARIARADKQRTEICIAEKLPPAAADEDVSVCVGQMLCAPAKLDWAVEKMTETGAARIDLISVRGQSATTARLNRWRRIAQAAAAQCQRATVPPVGAPIPLCNWLPLLPRMQKIMLSPRADNPLRTVWRPGPPTALLIGGESGLGEAEEQSAEKFGFVRAHLGARILRAETAAVAALAVIGALSPQPSCPKKD